jgi:hypothetical protein
MVRAGGALPLATGGGGAFAESWLTSGPTNWNLWGVPPEGRNGLLAYDKSGADNDGSDVSNGPMYAQPHFFADKGTLTALAAVLTTDAAGYDVSWVGLARNKVVAGNAYPDVTIPGSFGAIVGGGTGTRRLRGFAINVPVAQSGPEWMWLIYQSRAGSATYGPIIQAYNKDFARVLGRDNPVLRGLALGAFVAGNELGSPMPSGGGICGYEATWQASGIPPFGDPQAYSVGCNFPAGMPVMRSNVIDANVGDARYTTGWGFLRAINFTWTRG